MLDVVGGAEVPLVSLASDPSIVEPVEERYWVFKTAPANDLAVAKQLDFLQNCGLDQAALMYAETGYGWDGRDRFAAQAPAVGVTVLITESFNPGDTDFTTQLNSIAASEAEAMVFWGLSAEAAEMAIDADNLNLDIPILLANGACDLGFIDGAGEAANGVRAVCGRMMVVEDLADGNPQKPIILQYMADYTDTYGVDPDSFGGHAWDATRVISDALGTAGADRAGIRNALESTTAFAGITGVFNFSDQDHNGLKKDAFVIGGVVDGIWRLRSICPAQPAPHPILSDVNVRKAIAYCTNKDQIIAAAYPHLTPEQREELVMDTFVLKTSWAYTTPATTYPYNPTTGQALLDAAGWTLPSGDDIRTKDGKQLVLTLTTSDALWRQIFLAVFETQMEVCGIRIIRNHQPGPWWFGDDTGLFVRDFELGEFAWVGEDDPGGYELYACDQIALPTNGWSGWNSMGWCNEAASDAITSASNTELPQEQRKAHYATFIDLFAEDMPSLPLFLRENSYAWEHIDFNLQTFTQEADAAPGETTVLAYTDYSGNQGTITVPPGGVTETITLAYTPLVAPANGPPGNLETAVVFRLRALLSGVPQDIYSFAEPVTITVPYTVTDIGGISDEDSLTLYYWDGDSWEDASQTCPPGEQYSHLDTAQNLLEVRVCHITEFALMGGDYTIYLPLVLKNY
ncbi:MAG: ABC transporter substrate-binding protein [Promethearchaeota archaeon]